ncbi:hypothetical protein INS49_007374 [Diaporthe citri]|uniref:uncharacterized protein n=1 Tax=Diaporthe citri TaxID=83186 RepID=UPI001C810C00|nr:uncharacterized protein INS49_007374 [Diaporthe citri]KAG6365763.1 hypothetical protein INS49_007374 [Diaporthe citri]
METRPRRRRRPALSCQICRRRKIKCDHNEPCSNCLRHKAQCVYTLYGNGDGNEPRAVITSERPKRAFLEARQFNSVPGSSREQTTPAGAASGANPSPAEASAQQPTPAGTGSAHSPNRSAIEQNQIDGSHVNPRDSRTTAETPVVHVHNSRDTQLPVGRIDNQAVAFSLENVQAVGSKENHGVAELLERIRKLEESSEIRAEARSSDWLLQLALNKSRDLGKSPWMGMPQEFSTMIDCYTEMIGKDSGNASYKTPETASLVAQSGDFIQKCKDTAKNIKLGRPSRTQTSSPEIKLPPRDLSDAMINLYFSSFESSHRILHIPTFRAEYQRYWERPASAPTELRLKILLVIGLGSSLHEHQNTDAALNNADMVHQWIYAAQNWLSGPLEKDRLSISGLQIYCLTILARQIFSVGGDLTWISTGSLVQIAMQMGLHRDPKTLPAITPLQAELRRRLWVTILELVVQSSLDSWMPPRMHLDEFDTEPPSNLNDEDLNETATTVQPHPKSTFTATSIQLMLLESLPARLRIVQLLNSLHSDPTYPRILELSLALTEALQTCASKTKHNSSEHCTPFRRNFLDYLVRRFMLPLHMSFSSQSRAEPSYRHSRQASLDAALAIISPEPDAGFRRLMAVGGGMFREGQRCALTAVGLELIAHAEAQRLDGTLGRVGAYRDMLKGAVRDLLLLSEDRIRLGETNVKSHMFLRMILAQVEAVEAGVPVELEVARGTRDSLEFCYGILSLRATSIPESSAAPADAGVVASGIDEFQGYENYNMYGMGVDLDWESIMSDVGFS